MVNNFLSVMQNFFLFNPGDLNKEQNKGEESQNEEVETYPHNMSELSKQLVQRNTESENKNLFGSSETEQTKKRKVKNLLSLVNQKATLEDKIKEQQEYIHELCSEIEKPKQLSREIFHPSYFYLGKDSESMNKKLQLGEEKLKKLQEELGQLQKNKIHPLLKKYQKLISEEGIKNNPLLKQITTQKEQIEIIGENWEFV